MNGELIVGTVTVNSATLTAGPSNSYSSTAGSPLVQGVADFGSGYLIQSTAASTSTSWTTNASNKSDGVIASFLPAPYSCVGDFLLQGLKMEGIKIN
jgi:hypothetical protein